MGDRDRDRRRDRYDEDLLDYEAEDGYDGYSEDEEYYTQDYPRDRDRYRHRYRRSPSDESESEDDAGISVSPMVEVDAILCPEHKKNPVS